MSLRGDVNGGVGESVARGVIGWCDVCVSGNRAQAKEETERAAVAITTGAGISVSRVGNNSQVQED
jgi:hypothetical protein